MIILYMFYDSFSALTVGEISHAPFSASLPRNRVLCLFSSLRGFLLLYCPHCWSEPRRASTCAIILTPPFGFPSRFHAFGMLHAFARAGYFFLYSFVFQYQDLLVNQQCIVRLRSHRFFRSLFYERRRSLEFFSSLSAFR